MNISNRGLDLIKSFESLMLSPYLDSAGIPTIGYGTIKYESGVAVSIKDAPITKQRAMELLVHEVDKIVNSLQKFLTVNKLQWNQEQVDSLVSFCYNLGTGPVVSSGRSLNLALLQKSGVGNAMKLYCKITDKTGNKVVVKGLLNRRIKEAELYENGIYPV